MVNSTKLLTPQLLALQHHFLDVHINALSTVAITDSHVDMRICARNGKQKILQKSRHYSRSLLSTSNILSTIPTQPRVPSNLQPIPTSSLSLPIPTVYPAVEPFS